MPKKIAENWLTDNLCSLNEKVRIERGPQILEMDCDDACLHDEVTHRKYKIGARDTEGRLIRPDEAIAAHEAAGDAKGANLVRAQVARDQNLGRTPIAQGEKMKVADWRGQHAAWAWNIYQLQTSFEFDKDGNPISVDRFVKIVAIDGKENALEEAHKIAKEMD